MKASAQVAAFLSGRRGVYTTMRTVGLHSVFSLDEHVRRLAALPSAVEGGAAALNEADTAALVVSRVRAAVIDYLARQPHPTGELKISAALRPVMEEGGGPLVDLSHVEALVCVEPLVEAPRGPVAVELALARRGNPTVKHGGWIEERKRLEEGMRRECNEVVLAAEDERGVLRVSEGLSSNVLVLDDEGTLWTAPADLVLSGTVLELVLRVCKDTIPVRRECPPVDLLRRSSVMISSTSRLLLPVDRVFLVDGTLCRLPPFSAAAERLVAAVAEAIKSKCTRILQ